MMVRFGLIVTAFVVLGTSQRAEAVLTLRISGNGIGGAGFVDVADGSGLDGDGSAGSVSVLGLSLTPFGFSSIVFPVFSASAATTFDGVTLNLTQSSVYASIGGGSITVLAADSSFAFTSPAPPVFSATLTSSGGPVPPTVTLATSMYDSAAAVGPDPFGAPSTFTTPYATSGAGSFTSLPGTPLTLPLAIANGVSFTATPGSTGAITLSTTVANPEPASLVLSGLGMAALGLGAWRRKRRAAQAA
jgi:hypothetical protein